MDTSEIVAQNRIIEILKDHQKTVKEEMILISDEIAIDMSQKKLDRLLHLTNKYFFLEGGIQANERYLRTLKGEFVPLYPTTICSHCGQICDNQPPGNGCHTCGLGSMREEP